MSSRFLVFAFAVLAFCAVSLPAGLYTIQVVYVGGGGGGAAFAPKTVENINVSLGVTNDVDVSVEAITVAEQVEVTGVSDPVFSSTRTGAATSTDRIDIATLPTISGRISDITRLTPQASGNASFAGQDNRLNNITVDGSSFNNAFGLGDGQPGGRTGVAPISLESIEQVQVSVAPFDVRQGNFVGAAVNTVTRSGTNQSAGRFYDRFRNDSYVGTEAARISTSIRARSPSATRRVGRRPDRAATVCSSSATMKTRRTSGRSTPSAPTPVAQPSPATRRACSASDLDTLSAFLKQTSATTPAAIRTSRTRRRRSAICCAGTST